MEKQQPKNREKKSPAQDLWYLALAASLILNAYFLFSKKDKTDEVLATAGGQSFRWRDVTPARQTALQNLDTTYYNLLRAEAELWAENFVLPKEAAARGVTANDLLKTEVTDKAQPTQEEILAVYASSPAADARPWPKVLEEIAADLRGRRFREDKSRFMASLYPKYGVEFKLRPPASYREKTPASGHTRFPAYQAPAPGTGLNAQGRVIGPPSRGPADAPVTLEIYSDFMCPFSKKFSVTAAEIEKQYPAGVRTVFRHFPLPFHQGAAALHEAASCAQEQGKFWELHDRLMAAASSPDKEGLMKTASELGLDMAAFGACTDSSRYKAWVEAEIAAGKSAGVTGTPGFLINGRRSNGALAVTAVKEMVDWHLKPLGQYPGIKHNPPAPSSAPGGGSAKKAARPPLDPSKVVSLPEAWLKKGVSRGPAGAPITVVEVFDYNCPFCKKGADISEQLFEKYPGKIRILAKHRPLPMHPNAQKTSEALLCANEQNKFWEYRREIFTDSWGKFSPDELKAAARKTGLSDGPFAACLDGGKMKGEVEEDFKISGEVGAGGTPTFFVNGTPVVGAQPVENFQKLIDQKLSPKKS